MFITYVRQLEKNRLPDPQKPVRTSRLAHGFSAPEASRELSLMPASVQALKACTLSASIDVEACSAGFANLSRMRGIPQVGLAFHIWRISRIISGSVPGRQPESHMAG